MERHLPAGQPMNQKTVVVKVPCGVEGKACSERTREGMAALIVEHLGVLGLPLASRTS
jgi:hypothetical protein